MKFESKKFRHKQTGKIVTQVPILELSSYEEVEECSGHHNNIDELFQCPDCEELFQEVSNK